MTRKEAIQKLISWYKYDLIAKDWQGLDDIDLEIMKALKIEKPKSKKELC